MSRRTILEMKVEVAVNVVEEFCSIPNDCDVDSYADNLCDKWKKKESDKNFNYHIDYNLLDEMDGRTIGWIYEEEY